MSAYGQTPEDHLEQIDRRTERLEWAVFGVEGKGGILDRLDQLDSQLGRVAWRLTAAALSFAVGSAAVVITVLTQGHS